MDKKQFAERLVALRLNKNVSARKMSLDLGQSAGYLNNIESGDSFPSMAIFFEICNYLGVTPSEFLNLENASPRLTNEIQKEIAGLSQNELNALLIIIKEIKVKK